MNDHSDFRDRLVSSQQLNPGYRERYERSLQSMLDRRLTPRERLTVAAMVLFGIVVLAICIGSIVSDMGTSNEFKCFIGLIGLMVLVLTIVRTTVAVTGRVNMRLHPKLTAYVTFYGVLLFAIGVFTITAGLPHTSEQVYYVLVVLVALLLASAKLILTHVQQSELNMQEKLLEVELHLAEITEQLPNKQ